MIETIKALPLTFFLLCLVLLSYNCKHSPSTKNKIEDIIPSLDEVSGIWMSTDTMAIEPSIRNFRGMALLNRDITSVSWFVSAPYSGGHHTGTLKINDKTPEATLFRWQPYQALRKGMIDSLSIGSSTRMMVEDDAILWAVEIKNKHKTRKRVHVDLDMIGYISQYNEGDWKWWYPYPDWNGERTEERNPKLDSMRLQIPEDSYKNTKGWPTDEEVLNSKHYKATIQNQAILIQDKNTPAVSAFSLVTKPDAIQSMNSGGKATWNFELDPGESKVIKYFMTYGDNIDYMMGKVDEWSLHFDQSFNAIKNEWEKKWQQLFTPNNALVSGSFPILETTDQEVKRVYYMGPLTMLYLLNTNLKQHERVYLTGGPRWGATTTFFWDIAIWSDLWALVDPKMMKEHIKSWIKIDPNLSYGQDNLNGNGVGNGYSANYWCLFKIIRDYLVTTGDYTFLDEVIGGKTLLQHMEEYALNWQNLSNYGQPGYESELYKLADFGPDAWNLLECVPTYKHIVPSFNIGYVWMMRETAKIHKQRGNEEKADKLEILANEMTEDILQLYAGNGAWNSLYPNNKKVEVRHVLDFIYFGKFLADDVSPDIKKEMMDFFNRELRTNNWMRAQSLNDIAADFSDRPDHGPLGSFDGWIPEAMDAMDKMGYTEAALRFYRDIEPVTYEGGWAQARELWGENKLNKLARVRIAERGWNNRESSSGIGISQAVIRNFFGFNPQFDGKIIEDKKRWPFNGESELHHVYYRGAYYTIKFKDGKPVLFPESH
ncbi:hypothetical protein [Aestuariivivens insulae]|uniref:hypothetical protein n=1 Tax=Aestuariivivens insulae TaxID=1621988 RepID=UPI001F5A2DA1|nr:hypothetical protein [Aestuariivivens insulae]